MTTAKYNLYIHHSDIPISHSRQLFRQIRQEPGRYIGVVTAVAEDGHENIDTDRDRNKHRDRLE
jgi:hypothetical protein